MTKGPPIPRHSTPSLWISLLAAAAGFVALAAQAHRTPFSPIDLEVTHAIQRVPGPAFESLMHGISWLGFVPQVEVLVGLVVLTLFALGWRREAAVTAIAASGVAIGELVKMAVQRPRPDEHLVRVIQRLPDSGFPSSHVVEFTAFCGFLAYLAHRSMSPSWRRTGAVWLLAAVIVLMGPSRIHQGAHWFSDVMGAYLLGSIWLVLCIQVYRRVGMRVHA